jgi:hypothetical protein
MNKLHHPELEQFKRSVDLVLFAKKAGYEPRPDDGVQGLTVLEHPNRDRIAVARAPAGPWVYASVPDYVPKAADEPPEQALSRLVRAIEVSKDKGSIVEFVQQRDPLAGRGDVPLDRVRHRLRTYEVTGLPLDFEGALTAPPYPRGRERALDPVPLASAVDPKSELNRRRYDWSPPVENGPRETEVERRLREWREAQAAIERRQRAPREVPPAAPAASSRPLAAPIPERSVPDRGATAPSPAKSELGRRHYGWDRTVAPPDLEALIKGARNRSPDRGR